MSNTKKFADRAMRKGVKRSERKALKKVYGNLTPELRKKLKKSDEKMGLRQFVASLNK